MTPRAVVFERWLSHAVLWCCHVRRSSFSSRSSLDRRGASRVDDPRARACPFYTPPPFASLSSFDHSSHPLRASRARSDAARSLRAGMVSETRERDVSLCIWSAPRRLRSSPRRTPRRVREASPRANVAARGVASRRLGRVTPGPGPFIVLHAREDAFAVLVAKGLSRANISEVVAGGEPGSGCSPGTVARVGRQPTGEEGGRGVLGVRVGACAGARSRWDRTRSVAISGTVTLGGASRGSASGRVERAFENRARGRVRR